MTGQFHQVRLFRLKVVDVGRLLCQLMQAALSADGRVLCQVMAECFVS